MQTHTDDVPSPIRILELCTAGWLSASVSAVAALGLADELVARPRPLPELAEAVDAHAPTLYRLMRACADVGLFQELPDQTFALTELGRALVTDAPGSMRHYAVWMGDRAERYTWAHVAETVRTGGQAFEATHGQSIWDYMEDNPEVSRTFDRAMTELSSLIAPAVIKAYDFSGATVVVDIGGGHGNLLAAILTAHEKVRGVLYDRDAVIANAEQTFKNAGVSDRCELLAGDFLQSVPAVGDVYMLSNVLHNWDDEPALRILGNCRAAMRDDGRLVLVETVMPPATEPSLMAKMLDLDMMLLAGGRQRTEDELRELFRRAGLELSMIQHSPSGISSVIEAVPA